MDLSQQQTAQTYIGTPTSEELVYCDEPIQNQALRSGKRLKFSLEPSLKILEHHRNQTHVSDLVTDKRIADQFGPESTQMNDARSANKWPDKSDHEINGVIGGQDAQVADSWRKWIPGNQRFALLQIIFVSKNASLGVPTRPGGVNNACRILALSRHKNSARFGRAGRLQHGFA